MLADQDGASPDLPASFEIGANNQRTAAVATGGEPFDESGAVNAAAKVFRSHLIRTEGTKAANAEQLAVGLRAAARDSVNAQRGLMLTARVAASLDKTDAGIEFSGNNLINLVRLCSASEFFGEMLAGNPALISSLEGGTQRLKRRDYRAQLRASVDPRRLLLRDFALRRVVEIAH